VISLNRRPRPVAPDDDPAFLRRLDEQAWRAKRDSARASEAKPDETSEAAEHESAPEADAEATDAAEEDDSTPPSGDRRPGD
jgi:hypothetical protein